MFRDSVVRIYNYIHLDQDFSGDQPRWIINLHMNCEDIVQRNYKQRLSQKNMFSFLKIFIVFPFLF